MRQDAAYYVPLLLAYTFMSREEACGLGPRRSRTVILYHFHFSRRSACNPRIAPIEAAATRDWIPDEGGGSCWRGGCGGYSTISRITRVLSPFTPDRRHLAHSEVARQAGPKESKTHYGRCHCGEIRFEISGDAVHSSMCHCRDCRGQSGAPVAAWAMVPTANLMVEGVPREYASSETGRRSFCGSCGTGLFFSNAPLRQMEMVQVRIAALEDPNAIAPKMQVQVQVAERIGWMTAVDQLPVFNRFPT